MSTSNDIPEERIAAALAGVLEEGESFLVQGSEEGEVVVTSLPPFAQRQPDLYGRLLAVEEGMGQYSCFGVVLTLLVALALYSGLLLDGFDRWLGPTGDRWLLWTVLVVVAAPLLAFGIHRFRVRRAYVRRRAGLHRAIRDSELTAGELITALDGDPRVGGAIAQLKQDLPDGDYA